MAASTSTPYKLLGVNTKDSDLQLRVAYRARIDEYKLDRLKAPEKRKITADKFRLVCRAYETLSDHERRELYDQNSEWISDLPLAKYTLQQLAAEPALASGLKTRLQKATLRQIDAQDPSSGHTPLYCAARACNVEAVIYLTEQGAEPDLAQRLGSTALHVSAFYGHVEIVRCLLESGADYRKTNSFNNLAEAETIDNDIIRTFADLKEDPFVQAAADQIDWFKKNIDSIPHHIDEQYHAQRQTLLHCACKKGYLDLVRWLVGKRFADLDIVDINLNSALHLAAYSGHASIVKYLLNRGATSLLINRWGMTAEQEGIIHRDKITDLFQSMREQDMFKMAEDGIDWWFQYYFGDNSPDTANDKGTSLLYVASRYGQTPVVKWLLENGANVNIQIEGGSRSTPLHGAAYHGHVSTVELLLAHGADVNIKNQYGETAFQDARSDEVKKVLEKYRENLQENKIITVHIFGDGSRSGNEPLAKVQLHCGATRSDLRKAMPEDLRNKYNSFSIARRPLHFDEESTTIISAVCRARHGKSKFIELPLCITAHESPRYMHSGHVTSEEVIDYNAREFHGKFTAKCKDASLQIKAQCNETQTFTVGNLLFTFAVNCADENLSIDVQYILSADYDTFRLPECVCLFETKYHRKNDQLNEMPIVSFANDPNARMYSWIQPTPYWFAYSTRHIRLPFIGGVHAFIHHVDVIPSVLTLPPDIFIQAAVGKPFESRQTPVNCKCLKLRQHNTTAFPRIAYHGTSISVIRSILMDGLVMPSTVVSSGMRVCPPSNHIARGVSAFDIDDFANAIFLSPSIHYCSDPVYAVTFSDGDQRLLAVLECSVKNDSYGAFQSTVPTYVPHPDDDVDAMEWRFTNPAAIEIISILFIPVMQSRIAAAKSRANKLGVNPNDVV
jgi:ankyrin repeat protein